MAQSRLEKIGTIFSRVTGLLRSGAMKPEDKPIWYELYEAFPPKLEPRFDRPAPNISIRNIFYEEDVARAKFHKSLKQHEMISLLDTKRETQTQQLIKIYKGLKSQGALDEEKVFDTSVELLQQKIKDDSQEKLIESVENMDDQKPLSQAFNEAITSRDNSAQIKIRETSEKEAKKNSIGGIDIQNLFKD